MAFFCIYILRTIFVIGVFFFFYFLVTKYGKSNFFIEILPTHWPSDQFRSQPLVEVRRKKKKTTNQCYED
jgi:hypothetical protein